MWTDLVLFTITTLLGIGIGVGATLIWCNRKLDNAGEALLAAALLEQQAAQMRHMAQVLYNECRSWAFEQYALAKAKALNENN